MVTPVRRSTRRSLQTLPASLKDRKRSVTSLAELEGQDNLLYKPNSALPSDSPELDNWTQYCHAWRIY